MGRTAELSALSARLLGGRVSRLALVGGGGSGKSLLACAIGHKVKRAYPGGVHWFRIGAWGASTLFEMLGRRLGAPADPAGLTRALSGRGPTLIVLDNHESDRALARFLDSLRDCPVTWLVTARRCLLSGVEIFPVVPPLVTSHRNAFPRVGPLTQLLRWNPLALDIADRLVGTGALSLAQLRRWLQEGGVQRVVVMNHEDDVIEVRLLVDWAWAQLPAGARTMLAALAHTEGDDIDRDSLFALAGRSGSAREKQQHLARLQRWHLVQEPLADRFTLHAVVRQAVQSRTHFSPERYFLHYIRLLEQHPERVALEQTHLFAAMDHAHRTSNLRAAIRLERLLSRLSLLAGLSGNATG
jgi:signal transduction histidine kinase